MNEKNTPQSSVTSSIDFDAEGKQHGHLNLPHSSNSSAWGAVRLPVTVLKNGAGPTITFIAGNHGDEYEGPLALLKLASELDITEVSGRIILIPCLNAPAVAKASRLSPIDNLNMNRIFPGNRLGSLSEKIADYVATEIVPRSDIILDIHSGGKTLDFTPLAAVHFLDDSGQQKKSEDIMIAFGAPNSLRMREMDDRGMLDTLVESSGKIFVTTELGGGGSSTRESLEIAHTGCLNVLKHSNVLEGEVTLRSTRMLEMPQNQSFVIADREGMLEMCANIGGPVYKGSCIARIHDYRNSGVSAQEYNASRDGVLMARHFPGLIQAGDCLAVIAEEVPL